MIEEGGHQEPGTEPICGGVGASPCTTVPMEFFQVFCQRPSSWIFFSQSLTNVLNCSSPCLRPMPYGSVVKG